MPAGVDIDGLISGVPILMVGSGADSPVDGRRTPVTSQGYLISAQEFRSADEW
ncbi:hypothetical protein EDE12_11720 [Methylosinus sp. sav-2]|nr:hypothetical protein EDE12_11720 [Methylosinus sp. sav-2]